MLRALLLSTALAACATGGGNTTTTSSATGSATTGGMAPACGDAGIVIVGDGGALFVDDVRGSDDGACCGTAQAPCATLTHALTALGPAWGVTLDVAHDGGGGP